MYTGWRPRGRPRICLRDCISQLARLLGSVALEEEVWPDPLSMLLSLSIVHCGRTTVPIVMAA